MPTDPKSIQAWAIGSDPGHYHASFDVAFIVIGSRDAADTALAQQEAWNTRHYEAYQALMKTSYISTQPDQTLEEHCKWASEVWVPLRADWSRKYYKDNPPPFPDAESVDEVRPLPAYAEMSPIVSGEEEVP